MAVERIINTSSPLDSGDADEQELEQTLRPRDFKNYIGQERLKNNLKLSIGAAQKRGEPIDHVLLYGPPGLGKTTMASVIANEMGAQMRITSGPAVERAGDLASLLTNLSDGDILFIDEIHRLHRVIEEVLYSAMEDFKLDIMLGKGPSARSLRLDLPKFTIIGATTRTGSLAAPLRDRFGMIHRLEFYTPAGIALERGLVRDGMPREQSIRQWEEVWQPQENVHIIKHNPLKTSDVIIDGTSPFDEQIS